MTVTYILKDTGALALHYASENQRLTAQAEKEGTLLRKKQLQSEAFAYSQMDLMARNMRFECYEGALDMIERAFLALGREGNNVIEGKERDSWEAARDFLVNAGRML